MVCIIVVMVSVVKEKLVMEGFLGVIEKMKKGLFDFLGVILDIFVFLLDKIIDCDVIILMGILFGIVEFYDGIKVCFYSLQLDLVIYCNELDGFLELFDVWFFQFCLEEKKGEILEFFVGSFFIWVFYIKMVLVVVFYLEFWYWYFYKVYQLEQEQVWRDVLKQWVEQSIFEEFGWEEEEEEFMGILFIFLKEVKVFVVKIFIFFEGEFGFQSFCEENLVILVEFLVEVILLESSESIFFVIQIVNLVIVFEV